MSEISMYEAYKKKLQGICDENNLVFRFRHDQYPITLKISPTGGLDGQMDLLRNADEGGCTSPDASIVFEYKDGKLSYTMSKTFVISDTLFSKVKNLFKNLYFAWLQFFYRDLMEGGKLSKKMIPVIDDGDSTEVEGIDIPEGAEPLEELDEEAYPDDGELPDIGDDLPDADDPEIVKATQLVRSMNKASSGMLQREMGIGYAKAAKLIDSLEKLGVVGPFNGSQPREVLPYDVPEEAEADE